MRSLVRGAGDIGSAVAHALFRAGHAVAICDTPAPTTTRRGMSFADAIFDGSTELDGIAAVRVDELQHLQRIVPAREGVVVVTFDFHAVLRELRPDIIVDARMRKREHPESQRGLAPVTIGLGPNFIAGETTDLVVETSWDALGRVITSGASLAFAGEPREIGGHARDRYVYAPLDGIFQTKANIGDVVSSGEVVAQIGALDLHAPLTGALRGLTRDAVTVTRGTKVIEIDPRSRVAEVRGIGERPRRIAEGVLSALRRAGHL